MSSGPKNVTSTTNTEPPAWLAAPMQSALGSATGSFQRDKATDPRFGGNEGQFSPMQLMPQAQQQVSNTVQGNYLSPDTNPYLQSTFNRAADLTQGRLATEFARGGRDLDASMPARSDELQTLASNIFGGNYQAERDRQFNAVGQAESLDPLNQYFNRIAGIVPGAGGVTTSTQPVYKTGLF